MRFKEVIDPDLAQRPGFLRPEFPSRFAGLTRRLLACFDFPPFHQFI
jgi:hypothetical protein